MSDKAQILIIEDEQHLAKSIARRLQAEGYIVDISMERIGLINRIRGKLSLMSLWQH